MQPDEKVSWLFVWFGGFFFGFFAGYMTHRLLMTFVRYICEDSDKKRGSL